MFDRSPLPQCGRTSSSAHGFEDSIEDMYVNEPEGVILVPDTPPLPQHAQPAHPIMDPAHNEEDDISSFTYTTTTSRSDEQLEPSAKQILCKILRNDRAEWTCKEQKEAILTVLQLRQDAIIAMRTGSGKTMLPIIASQLETDHVTIVVLPLKSLMNDYIRRLNKMGIGHEVFEGKETKCLTGAHNLVLVSADKKIGRAHV